MWVIDHKNMGGEVAFRSTLRKRIGAGNRGGLAAYGFVAPSIIFILIFVLLPITVVVLIFAHAFEYLKMGYASAMSFILFIVIGVVTLINARLLRYDIGY